MPRIQCDRHHRQTGRLIERKDANFVTMLHARGHPGSLRKDQDRPPARSSSDSIIAKFAKCTHARRPVHGNAAGLAEIPAKKRQPQQFAFQHKDRRVEKQRQHHCFPGGLMFGCVDHLTAGMRVA